MFTIIINTVIIYFFLILAIRLMGKRQLGELQLSELITTILLSEIASAPITNTKLPITHALISILIIITFEIILPILMSKFTFLKRIIEGRPSYIIFKGKLSQKEMKKNRITIEELLASLRTNNISDISDVDYLILEPNGKLSIFPKNSKREVTIEDASLQTKDRGLAHSLIIDGRICKANLDMLAMDEKLLSKILVRYNVHAEDLFLLSIDDSGEIYIIRKDQKI